MTAKKFSIAMVAACPFPANYGSPASIREMSETLAGFGHNVHIVTYPHGDDLPVGGAHIHRVEPTGGDHQVRVGPSSDKPVLDWRLLRLLVRVIREHDIQVIHAHNYEAALIGLAAKVITGKPLLYNAVNTMVDELPGYGFIKPAFVARGLAKALDWFVPLFPDHITAVSELLLAGLIQQGVSPDRATYVPAGILPEMFDNADAGKFRRHYNLGSRKVVMYTGTLGAFQRMENLFNAYRVVAREEPSAVLMVVDSIPEPALIEKYKAMANALGYADKVIWVEQHPLGDLPHYLASADATVVPRPDCPGHPVKLLNYMIAARPIVAFAGGAKGLTDRHDALVVPDGDCEAMGQAIVKLLRDSEFANRLGANARRTVLSQFDWRLLCRKIEVIYEGLVEHAGRVDREVCRNGVRMDKSVQ